MDDSSAVYPQVVDFGTGAEVVLRSEESEMALE
jgi:hypothetical protein